MTKQTNQFAVFSSNGKLMSEPFNSWEAANAYCEQLRVDFVEDRDTMFWVEAI
jgi:hypothetical protein